MATKKAQPKKTPKKSGKKKLEASDARKSGNEMYRMGLTLRENPLLEGWAQSEIDYLSHNLSLRSVPKGKVIFKEGDHGDYMFFVIHGKVEARLDSSRNHHVLGLFNSGSLVGEMALIDEYPRSATVSTIEDTEILILTKTKFKTILQDKPGLGIKLLLSISRVISTRLRNTMGRFFELA